MKSYRYLAAALLAFIIWGFFSLAVRPLAGYASLDILFFRVFISVTLMMIIGVIARRAAWRETLRSFRNMTPAERRNWWLVSAGGGALLTANWFFFIYVMNHVGVKVASFSYLICPILTTVLAFFILKEKLRFRQWIAVALSLVSCVMLALGHFADTAFSLIVAVSYALYLVIQRRAGSVDKFVLLTTQMAFSALFLLPFYPVWGHNPGWDVFFLGMTSLIAVCFTIIPLMLNLYALQGANSSTVGILLYINPLINFALAIFYYGEKVNAVQLVAYALIGFSIILFNAHYFRAMFTKPMWKKPLDRVRGPGARNA
ncbi:EamA family transporter [Nostoc ellipsosporum NOK]|nr:EamA family transporter [Nostoc ellipsosporum NOK]